MVFAAADFVGGCAFQEQLDGFAQIGQCFLDVGALAGDVQLGTKRRVSVVFFFDQGGVTGGFHGSIFRGKTGFVKRADHLIPVNVIPWMK